MLWIVIYLLLLIAFGVLAWLICDARR